VPRTVTVEEFLAGASSLLEGVSGGEDVVVIRRGDAPVAVLAAPWRGQPASSLSGLPRWELWLSEMKRSFPGPAQGQEALEATGREPAVVDKALLGFDPAAGTVGSDAGREHLSRELARLNTPIRDEQVLGELYAAVLDLCAEKERVYEDDLRLLAQEAMARAPRRLRLLALTVTTATGLPATAEVTVELGQGPAMRREQGDGPLDAAFKAIQRLTGVEPTVENFSVVAATPGRDALAEAVIELVHHGERVVGTGASTNAIEAGVSAYVNALNFLLEQVPQP
jgi:antitoxin (DNA-binding transcriptional repressor) of toxin-antitoxin stability system